MKLLDLACLVFTFFCLPISSPGDDTFYFVAKSESKADGKKFCFRITSDELNATPSWSDKDDNPPVSAQKAIGQAHAQLKMLVREPRRWKLVRAALERAYGEKWYWEVQYSETAKKPKVGTAPVFRIVVLMDGKTPKPKVEE